MLTDFCRTMLSYYRTQLWPPEQLESAHAALSLAISPHDDRRLAQPQTAGRDRIPEGGESSTSRATGRPSHSFFQRPTSASGEVLTAGGLIRYFVLFVIDLKTRRVEIAGISHQPHNEWMKQVARNLTDVVDGFLRDARYLIHVRDPLFSESFLRRALPSGEEPPRPRQRADCPPAREVQNRRWRSWSRTSWRDAPILLP